MSRSTPLDLPSLTRVRYFSGQLLSADDFITEQRYHRDRARLHNRLLHGAGVVAGLEVRTSGGQIVITPGMALDPAGDEIIVAAEHVVASPAKNGGAKAQFVVVRYLETPTSPVLPVGASDGDTQHSRVIESFSVTIEETAPARGDVSVTLARLTWRGGKWRVDSRFKLRKVRR